LLTAAIGGDRRALSRLLTALEGGEGRLPAILPDLLAAGRDAQVVGITGPPGSGKSTLVDALTAEWRAAGRAVGILAVDPSSPVTGGAILGDRIRMMAHSADPDVFIRSMASRGVLGGLAATTWLAAAALDAAGFDPVLIETVGAGQSEVEVAALADTTVVVEAPEMGDEVQAIKAGLLEVADLVVVNKGDRPGADRTARQLRAMLSPAGGRLPRTAPPVLVTSALERTGISELATAVGKHRAVADQPERALKRAEERILRLVADDARGRARANPAWATETRAVAERKTDPLTAARRLLGLPS
jgi:LAO/AO transport system kinase